MVTEKIVKTDSEGIKQIRKPIGYFEKPQDAIKALAKYNENPYSLDAKKITFKEIYDKWSSTDAYIVLSDYTKINVIVQI